jgi:hypothetical protein
MEIWREPTNKIKILSISVESISIGSNEKVEKLGIGYKSQMKDQPACSKRLE